MKHIYSIIIVFIFSLGLNAQNVFTVTKTTDPNPFTHPYNNVDSLCDTVMYGTLQWAIRKTNDATGTSIINFNIPGSGIQVINLNGYLPQIINPVTIDATTQNGYVKGNPTIVLNGFKKMIEGLNFYKTSGIVVTGIGIKDFVERGIRISNCSNIVISDCVIDGIHANNEKLGIGISFYESTNAAVYGNLIGFGLSTSNSGISYGGIVTLEKSHNINIGDTDLNLQNTIKNCQKSGIFIGKSTYFNKISGNILINNTKAIFLADNGNNNKLAPGSLVYYSDNNLLVGVSEPNDTIEIFGSTGNENANEYILSVTADANGNWQAVNINTSFDYFVATATDAIKNSSQLSNISEVKSLSVAMCDTTEFTINISGYNSSDTVTISLNIPNGFITVDSANVSDASANIDINYDTLNTIFTITNLSTTSIIFYYYITTDCELFNPNSSTEYSNNYIISYNNTTYNDTTTSYQVNSPWLLFDLSNSHNLNYSNAISNVSFERRYYYINSTANSFNGSIKFTDIVNATQNTTALFIDNIDVSTNANSYTIENIDVNDTSAVISVNINNLQQGDSIVFVETVHLDGCYDGFNNISFYHANYGCDTNNLCNTINNNLNTTATYDPNDKPLLKYEQLTTGYPACWKDTMVRIIRIINIGGADADSVYIGFDNINDNTYIDSSSFGLFTDSLFNNPFPYHTTNTNLIYTNYYANITGVLASGDTLYIRYNEIIQCIDTSLYESYYNNTISMHYDGFPYVKLFHQCYPTQTISYDDNEYKWKNWEHNYSLSQIFNNMIGTLNDQDEEWFNVDNSTNLILEGTGTYKGFITNMDSSEIRIELVLDPGLGLITDSIYMQSVQGTDTIRIYPYNIEYLLTNNPLSGNGDTIYAYFNFPDSFYTANNYNIPCGFTQVPTTYYNDFFENFSVRFKLKAYCEHIINGGKAKIRQNFLFVPNRRCQDCALPLSSVSDEINIHCPGCVLPGWNLDAFNITRTNFGYADNNNNNYPDSYPYELTTVDTSLVNIHSMIIGDTINIKLSGFASDGEDIRYCNIGFDYKYGQLVILGKLLDDLNFIGASGYFTDSINFYNFNINSYSQVPVVDSGQFALNLSFDSLVSYGIDTSLYNRFWGGNTMAIDLQFVVKNNLIHGTGFDPYYSIEGLDAKFNMSGVPYPGIDILTDAGETLENDSAYFYHLWSVDSIKYFNYWCTGYEGRAKAIGVDYNDYLHSVTNYAYTNNPCYNSITSKYFTDIGRKFVTGTYANQGGNQTAWNAFSYELRNLWMLDTIKFTYPKYLEIDSIFFNTTQLTSDGSGGNTHYTYNPYYYNNIFNYDLTIPGNFIADSTSITIFPSANLAKITEYLAKDSLNFYDETKRYRIYTVLKIKDYQNMPDSIFYDSCMVISHWSNFPGTISGDTIITDTLLPFTIFTKPIVELETQYTNLQQNTSSSDIVWDIDIRPNMINTYNIKNYNLTRAENAFVYIYSNSGNITVDSLLWRNASYPNNAVNIVDTINNIPLFGLGFIGNDYYTANYKEGNLTAFVSYDCSQISNTDTTIYMITGWNCYGYPDTLLADSVCYMDTTIIPIHITNPGLQAIFTYPDTINTCDTVHYQILLNSTTLSDVDNIEINLNYPLNQEFTYIQNSAFLTHISDGNTIQIEPDTNYNWQLDSIGFLQEFAVDSVLFEFDILPSCGFENQVINITISSENYCGRALDTIFISNSGQIIKNLPKLDSLSISINAENSIGCYDSSLVTIVITNLGDSITGASNTVDVSLPNPYVYLSGQNYLSYVSNTLTFSVTDSIASLNNDTIKFYIYNNSPVNCNDSMTIVCCTNIASEYICGSDTCYHTQTNYNTQDSTVFYIHKPQVEFTGEIQVLTCDSADPKINVEITNSTNLTADSVFINYYCISDSSGVLPNPCLFWTDSITSILGEDTLIISNIMDSLCTNCTEIMLVLSGCICENDTLTYNLNNALSAPTITDISPLSPCLYAGSPMQLAHNATNADNFFWQFGNGDISSDEHANYSFPSDGYYCITLEVSNACGSAQYSETLFVLPDNCACSTAQGGTINYDIPDGYTITSNETWDNTNYSTGEVLVQGDVFVEPNSTLTIDSLTVHFAPKGRIIVKGTGHLKLPNNTVLTGLSSCNNMWQGIEVWGDGNDPAISNINTQGVIYDAKATIENAHIAILLGARNMNVFCDNSEELFNRNLSGGYAKIDHINFINNGIGIKAIQKQNNYKNFAVINYCNLFSTTLLDNKYNSNNTTHYPTYSNPFVYASPSGRTIAGIWLDRCDNNINGNSYFNQNTFTNIDTCIKAIDSKINVENSTFTNASYGFYALNTNTSLNSQHIIKNNTFKQIHDAQTNHGTAIYLALCHNDIIYNNFIKNTDPQITDCDDAITMVLSPDCEVTENIIRNYKKGITAIWNITGLIGAGAPNWKGNEIKHCNTGISTILNNSNLILKCNDHMPYNTSPTYDVNWDNSGIRIFFPPFINIDLTLGDQGQDGYNTDDPAGNRFQSPFHKEIRSNTTYNYYHHLNGSSTNVFRPELDANSQYIARIYNGVPYISDAAACGGNPGYVWPPITLPGFNLNKYPYTEIANMKNENESLLADYNNIIANIDNGQTQSLLNDIYNGASPWNLTVDLYQNSPLSDTVIYSIMAEDVLYPWQFYMVIRKNMPLSNKLVKDFYTYIDNYPSFIKHWLKYIQMHGKGNTPAHLKKQLGQAKTRYYQKLDKLADALLDSTNYRKDDAIALLEYDGSLKSKQILFGTYIEDNRFADAAQKLNEIEAMNIDYMNDYVTLNQILLNLRQNYLSIRDIDSLNFVVINNLAHKCPESPAVYQARAIVEILKGEHIESCGHFTQKRTVAMQTSNAILPSRKSEEVILGENYPDPFTDYTFIPYTLPYKTEGKIIITNVLGKIIKTIPVDDNKMEIKLQTKNWATGTYYYSLEINNIILSTKKMILTK